MNKDTLTHSIHRENVLDNKFPRAKIIALEVSDEVFHLMKMVSLPKYYEMAEELLEANKLSLKIKTKVLELLGQVKENLAFNN